MDVDGDRPPAGGLGAQVEELSVSAGRGDRGTRERAQRRVIGLQYRELGDVGARDHAADAALAQVGRQGLYLGKFRHIIDCALPGAVPAPRVVIPGGPGDSHPVTSTRSGA